MVKKQPGRDRLGSAQRAIVMLLSDVGGQASSATPSRHAGGRPGQLPQSQASTRMPAIEAAATRSAHSSLGYHLSVSELAVSDGTMAPGTSDPIGSHQPSTSMLHHYSAQTTKEAP